MDLAECTLLDLPTFESSSVLTVLPSVKRQSSVPVRFQKSDRFFLGLNLGESTMLSVGCRGIGSVYLPSPSPHIRIYDFAENDEDDGDQEGDEGEGKGKGDDDDGDGEDCE